MFDTVLIANRGAIACRVIRTLRRMGIRSVAVYSEADRHSLHVAMADEAVCIGAAPARESYLNQAKLLEAARSTGAQAIHPGYGFLSENASFAEACAAAGIVFVGPTPAQMRDFGMKHTARELARSQGVPLLPGTGLLRDLAHAEGEAERIGYPVMLKSTAGGGGIGMQLCRQAADLSAAYASVERLARSNFADGGLFLEKYIERARHLEVQIFGDGAGTVIALGERDCSMQRRNQKVIEETPAPGISPETRAALQAAAILLGKAAGYRSAGTVEFVYDIDEQEFYFLEVNTRLQVEHGVTEAVTGVDLVEWMIRVAAGEPPALSEYQHQPRGHALQVRLYAEDPARNFRPSSGLLSEVALPPDVRVDGWIETGTAVPAFYDPLLAKIVEHGASREEALAKMGIALAQTRLYGIETNLEWLRHIIEEETFREGRQYTRFLSNISYAPPTVEVLQPGMHTTVQDHPGRVGYWNVGVPPSGPMDSLAFTLANRMVGNDEGAAALELTGAGPTLLFAAPSVVALAGASSMRAELDGTPLSFWQPVVVAAGSTLKLGAIQGIGQRAYLAVKGGFDVPDYLGSKSTFTLGQFGGHAGRALQAGDVLRLTRSTADLAGCMPTPAALIPVYENHWDIAVTSGPHGAPDFFTAKDMETFFATDWQVHYNSSRTGVRLLGPRPEWARRDGGEAGLHPSNIHDNAYAIGSIDYTGDMPVILGPDGPSLGGFVCPVTITRADLWKIGQLRPGDRIRFRLTAPDDPAVLYQQAADVTRPAMCVRQAGEDNVLVEYGPIVLDLELRFRVHSLMQWFAALNEPAIVDLTPGIRSLQIHYDSLKLPRARILQLVLEAESSLPAIDDMEVPSRIVHLPLSWDDPATQLAIEKYMQSARAAAPWCPSNIEFIRRINGLYSTEDVRRIVFDASYLVMGLGDVYLGAPVATPLDPRHRLVTTKYNPARTWTPENAVGIGGAYLCVYGMEGPGGYQFVGRTVQMWNRHRQTADFIEGRQWLLRFFDQLRFYPVSPAELARMREDFPQGKFKLRIEHTVLKLRDYREFLAKNAASISGFKSRQQAAFEAERERWRVSGADAAVESYGEPAAGASEVREALALPEGCVGVSSTVTGSVWQISVEPGQRVAAGDELLVVEAMKMEIPLLASEGGEIIDIRCARGRAVSAGETLIVLRPLAGGAQ